MSSMQNSHQTSKDKKGLSFQQKIFLKLADKKKVTIPRSFMRLTGDIETAAFLSQLIYWSDKGKRQDGWIYKSDKEWKEELFISRYAIRKARKKLKDMGILETRIKRANGSPTVHYKLNGKELFAALMICDIEKAQ